MRSIPDPGSAGDDGSAPAAVAAALAEVAAGAPLESAVSALTGARVLVPVVATAGEMAAVLLTGRDGRRALLAFSSLSTLHAWDPKARPAPVPLVQAAQAAVAEGADAVVVDVAGPVPVPVEGAALRRIADGQRLVGVDDGWAWAAPLPDQPEGSTGPV